MTAPNKMQPEDVLQALFRVAGTGEEDVIERLAIRAGFWWRCPCGWILGVGLESACTECGTAAPMREACPHGDDVATCNESCRHYDHGTGHRCGDCDDWQEDEWEGVEE